MALLRVCGSSIFAFIIWRLIKRYRTPKSPLAHILGPKKEHWLKGNFHRIFQDGLRYNLDLVKQYGGAVKIYALLGVKALILDQEQLYISDPLALHHIVVKEQNVYEETDMFIVGNRLIFGEGLIATLGEQHRKQRKMLNPVFSLANMRDLLPVIQPIADQLRTILMAKIPADGSVVEVNLLPWVSRGALEYICQAALGHSFDALDPTKENEYIEAIRTLAPSTLRLIFLRPFIPMIVRRFSLYWRNKMMDWMPSDALKNLRHVVNVMDTASKNIFAEKKVTLENEGFVGNVGKCMKVRANASSSNDDRLTDSELLGQMNTIIFAGFETTTSATCRILWILAEKQDVQARLRSEIRKAKREYAAAQGLSGPWEDVEVPYDTLMALPYLDAIVRETLRVYPPTSLLSRTARQASVLPLHQPIRSASGEMISSIYVPENTTLIISILASNHNKEIWGEDASEWRPERWLSPSGERLHLGDGEGDSMSGGIKDGMKYPGVYGLIRAESRGERRMTFLGGGRACIGFKFAEMEISTLSCLFRMQ
ncbi:cytochrome P450 [Suillus paluster]|uniref:cytochrome P450 n=1 Tax=Suillus paluster TaxID=48578 RepID=UPI001B883898|nr:cytochrome P450 [Suillus paluster]KAG1744162.1 cytochrome P450 [Suillus paluster]